jgi:hypothetical protein
LGIGIIEARGDDDVFPSSSLEGEYVSLEGCCYHKGLVHFSTKGFLKAELSLYTKLGACIHNLIGVSQEEPQRHHKATKPSRVP